MILHFHSTTYCHLFVGVLGYIILVNLAGAGDRTRGISNAVPFGYPINTIIQNFHFYLIGNKKSFKNIKSETIIQLRRIFVADIK